MKKLLQSNSDVTACNEENLKTLQSNKNVTDSVTNPLLQSNENSDQCDKKLHRNKNVTGNVTLEKEKDKSLISSLSSLREGDAVKNEIVNLYRTNCNPMMAEIELERLLDCIDHYGPVWTKEAIETAVSKGKRNIAYIEGILKNWEVEGHEKCSNSKRKKTIQRKARKVTDGTETDWDAEAGKGWDD